MKPDIHRQYDWMAVPLSEVREGDWYANGGTVTIVTKGPGDVDHPWGGTEHVKRGEIRIDCGLRHVDAEPGQPCRGRRPQAACGALRCLIPPPSARTWPCCAKAGPR